MTILLYDNTNGLDQIHHCISRVFTTKTKKWIYIVSKSKRTKHIYLRGKMWYNAVFNWDQSVSVNKPKVLDNDSFHTVSVSTCQWLEFVDVKGLAVRLVRLAPLHLDQLRRPWPALRVEAECKVLSGVLYMAHQLNRWIIHYPLILNI